jgi:hypothetical protein
MIKNCFVCKHSEIDPGSLGCHTMPNGDPGYPSDPATTTCLHPEASIMEEEFYDIIADTERAIRNIIFRNSLEYHNCDSDKATKMTLNIKQKIYNMFVLYYDFGQFCPKFEKDPERNLDKIELF